MTNTNSHLSMVWSWPRTLRISMWIALGFTILSFVMQASGEGAWRNWRGWLEWYGINLVISLCVSVSIRTAFACCFRWLGQSRVLGFSAPGRAAFFTLVPMLGVAVGWPIGSLLTGQLGQSLSGMHDANSIAGAVLLSALISSIFYVIFNATARQAEAERRETEAQLRLLQAQIEPHFLFNTLANVISLIDHDAPKAKQMLESFTDYLRSSLGSLRREDATLGNELDLAQAYLMLLKTRMEDRLSFDISVNGDPALRQLQLPPLLLQPLVENAIHHGLEPQVDGGRVQVSAHREGNELVLEVRDDGRGPDVPPRPGGRKGSGLALANIRSRLLQRYGSQASLQLLAGESAGTRAIIRLPAESTAGAPA